MIRAVLFELGQTAAQRKNSDLDIVEALKTICAFSDGAGAKLKVVLLSEGETSKGSKLATQKRVPEERPAAMTRNSGLAPHFDPSDVMVITREQILNPDLKLIESAARHAGASITECLLVAKAHSLLEKAQALGMSVLAIGKIKPAIPSFTNWLEAPYKVARLVAPSLHANIEKAISFQLLRQEGITNFRFLSKEGSMRFHGQGSRKVPLRAGDLEELEGTLVDMTVDVSVDCNIPGDTCSFEVSEPSQQDYLETTTYVRGLVRKGHVSNESGPLLPGVTHVIKKNTDGSSKLTRKRRSAR